MKWCESNSSESTHCDEFKQLVMGKSPDELVAVLDRPNGAEDNDDSTPNNWQYWDRVRNPAMDKTNTVWLYFQSGKVTRISW